jgi:hypothetical protein
MAISAMIFRCDRDAVEAPAQSQMGALPEGWVTINISGGPLPLNGHLCPACTAAFNGFMTALGGTFSLKPATAPQTPAPTASATPAAAPAAAQP